MESESPRRFGPPAHDQRGKHRIVGELSAHNGLGAVEEYDRLVRLAGKTKPTLKASIPGPFTLSGRLIPGGAYSDRYAVTEALIPIVREEIGKLVDAGCAEITVDEPSMSCYAYKEDCKRFVDIFNRTVEPAFRKVRLSTHLCFGNFRGHAVGFRKYAPMFPDFLDFHVDEIHLEMASREYGEIEIIKEVSKIKDVVVGVIDVKSYFIESPDHIANRVRKCMEFAPAERLSFAPDCGLSQTARWAAKQKLDNMVAGVRDRPKGNRLMIKCFQKDQELIDDINSTKDSESKNFRTWWLGQSGFLVQFNGSHLLFDPYLSDSLTKKYSETDKPHVRMTELVVDPGQLNFVDVVTSSHNHTDHFGRRNFDSIDCVESKFDGCCT